MNPTPRQFSEEVSDLVTGACWQAAPKSCDGQERMGGETHCAQEQQVIYARSDEIPGTRLAMNAFADFPCRTLGVLAMPFTLRPLPFAKDSLGPTMSDRTLDFHHGKHHATYVKKLNDLVAGTKFENASLEDVIRATAKAEGKEKKIFNNAAQVWNHDFFWESIAPNGGGTPPEPIGKRIDASFGSFANFRDTFVEAATDQFGSGWAWLVLKGGKLEIVTTHDADNPLTLSTHALWTCDVWEHAYYLDYQNERPRFVKAVLEQIANWQFVSKRLVEAEK